MDMIFQTGENRAVSQNEVLSFEYIRFPSTPQYCSKAGCNIVICVLNFKKSIIIKPFNYFFYLTENCQGMYYGSIEGILAVENHVSSSQKYDFHCYYHTSSKTSGNEPFHIQLPISATKAQRDFIGMQAIEVHNPLQKYRSACLQDYRY